MWKQYLMEVTPQIIGLKMVFLISGAEINGDHLEKDKNRSIPNITPKSKLQMVGELHVKIETKE